MMIHNWKYWIFHIVIALSMLPLKAHEFVRSPVLYKLPSNFAQDAVIKILSHPISKELYLITASHSLLSIRFLALNVTTETSEVLSDQEHDFPDLEPRILADVFQVEFIKDKNVIQMIMRYASQFLFVEMSPRGDLLRFHLFDSRTYYVKICNSGTCGSPGDVNAFWNSNGMISIMETGTVDGHFLHRFDSDWNLIASGLLQNGDMIGESWRFEEFFQSRDQLVLWSIQNREQLAPLSVNPSYPGANDSYQVSEWWPFKNTFCSLIGRTYSSGKIINMKNDSVLACGDMNIVLIDGVGGSVLASSNTLNHPYGIHSKFDRNNQYIYRLTSNPLSMCTDCNLIFQIHSIPGLKMLCSQIIGPFLNTEPLDFEYSPSTDSFFIVVRLLKTRIIDRRSYDAGRYLFQFRPNSGPSTVLQHHQPTTTPSPTKSDSPNTMIGSSEFVLPTILGAVFVVLFAIPAGYFLLKKWKNQSTPVGKMESGVETQFTAVTTLCATDVLAIPAFLIISSTNSIRRKKQLSEGGGGSIHLVDIINPELEQRAKSKVAIAKLLLKCNVHAFNQEISLMHYLSSKYPNHFARLLGYDPDAFTMIMPYYSMGSLYDFVHIPESQYQDLSLQTKIQLFQDIARAISFMHNESMAHCDLKPDNILMEMDQTFGKIHAILTDLGISRVLNDDVIRVKNFQTVRILGLSLSYAAPELLEYFHDSKKTIGFKPTDIYSFSCILYECLCLTRPWKMTMTQ